MIADIEKAVVTILKLKKGKLIDNVQKEKLKKEITLHPDKVLPLFSNIESNSDGDISKKLIEYLEKSANTPETKEDSKKKSVSKLMGFEKRGEIERRNSFSNTGSLEEKFRLPILKSEVIAEEQPTKLGYRNKSSDRSFNKKGHNDTKADYFLQDACKERFSSLYRSSKKTFRNFRKNCLELFHDTSTFSKIENFLKYIHLEFFGVQRIFLFILDEFSSWNIIKDLRGQRTSISFEVQYELNRLFTVLPSNQGKFVKEGLLIDYIAKIGLDKGIKLFCSKITTKNENQVLLVCEIKIMDHFLAHSVDLEFPEMCTYARIKKTYKSFIVWFCKLHFEFQEQKLSTDEKSVFYLNTTAHILLRLGFSGKMDKIIDRVLRTYERIVKSGMKSYELKWKKLLEGLLGGKLLRAKPEELMLEVVQNPLISCKGEIEDFCFFNKSKIETTTLNLCLHEATNSLAKFEQFLYDQRNFIGAFRDHIFNYQKATMEINKRGFIKAIYRPLSNRLREKLLKHADEHVVSEKGIAYETFFRDENIIQDLNKAMLHEKAEPLIIQSKGSKNFYRIETNKNIDGNEKAKQKIKLVIDDPDHSLDVFLVISSSPCLKLSLTRGDYSNPSPCAPNKTLEQLKNTLNLLQTEDGSKLYIQEFIPEHLAGKLSDKQESPRLTSFIFNSKNFNKYVSFDEIKSDKLSDEDELIQINSTKTLGLKIRRNRTSPSITLKPTPDVFKSKLEDMDITSMNFNILIVENLLEKHRYVWKVFEAIGVIEGYSISLEILGNFLDNLQKKYNKRGNPFHNYDHGINVMHGCYYLSKQTKASRFFSSRELFSLVFSGLCHDADHTGHNNAFEISSFSKLANRYHDRSVLEQHHIAITFKLLHHESSNIFENVRAEDVREIRKLVISNILYTDMKEHFSLCGQFESISQNIEEMDLENLFGKEQNKQVLMGLLIHAADFSGSVKPFAISSQWSKKVNQEFSNQYQDEQELEIPQTPYMKDLDKPEVMAKAEMGFIKAIVLPLWTQLNSIFKGEVSHCVENLIKNKQEWEKLTIEHTELKLPKEPPVEKCEGKEMINSI